MTVSGGGNSRVFLVDGGVTASISGMTITGGHTSGFGGGLYNLGTLALTNCTVSGNQANGMNAYGGGIYALNSTVDVENSNVNGNKANGSADGEGGGI